MGDIDTNLFQPQPTHSHANETVVQYAGAEIKTGHAQNNKVHIMNARKNTNEEKQREGRKTERWRLKNDGIKNFQPREER